MAPTYTNMDHHHQQAVQPILINQLPPQPIDLTSSIFTSDYNNIQFGNEFQFDEQIRNEHQEEEEQQQQHGISGTTPGYYMGRQSVTDAVTIQC